MDKLNWESKFENKLGLTENDYNEILKRINDEENEEKTRIIPIFCNIPVPTRKLIANILNNSLVFDFFKNKHVSIQFRNSVAKSVQPFKILLFAPVSALLEFVILASILSRIKESLHVPGNKLNSRIHPQFSKISSASQQTHQKSQSAGAHQNSCYFFQNITHKSDCPHTKQTYQSSQPHKNHHQNHLIPLHLI